MRAIGPPLTDEERAAFIAAARSFLHVPFRHQGRSARGLDCGGLVVVSLVAIGRTPADVAAYGREPQGQGLHAACVANFGEPVFGPQMRAGDVLLMRFRGEPSHVGIVSDYPLGGFALIHSYAQVRKVTEHRMDAEWLGYVTEVFRP